MKYTNNNLTLTGLGRWVIIDVSVPISVFTTKWHKLTHWQLTASGDWLSIVNCIHRMFTHYLISILYPQVLWILTSTCVAVLLCIATDSWVPIHMHGYLMKI